MINLTNKQKTNMHNFKVAKSKEIIDAKYSAKVYSLNYITNTIMCSGYLFSKMFSDICFATKEDLNKYLKQKRKLFQTAECLIDTEIVKLI